MWPPISVEISPLQTSAGVSRVGAAVSVSAPRNDLVQTSKGGPKQKCLIFGSVLELIAIFCLKAAPFLDPGTVFAFFGAIFLVHTGKVFVYQV